MKTLFLVRHAKSDWSQLGQHDHDRSLNERGQRDAPRMGQLLRGVLCATTPDQKMPSVQLVSSSAVRAYTTAQFFINALSIDSECLTKESAIYEASEDDIMEVIKSLDKTQDIAILFGHNPTFTFLANRFIKDKFLQIDNMPTCSIVRIVSTATSWEVFSPKNSELKGFWYPKML